MANNLVSVWGSVGAGKTLTSVKIAKALAEKKNNVFLLLCDDVTPSLPLLLPSETNTKSLGDLLSLSALKQIHVFQHCVTAGGYLSLLGYQDKETELTYPEYDQKRAKELLSLLSRSADYVVIDCNSHVLSSILTGVALETADTVFRVFNADIKSLIYFRSQQYFLREARYRYDKQINVLNNVYPNQGFNPHREAFGEISYMLPNLPMLKEQYDSGKLLEDLAGRDAKKYEPVIKTMVSEVILYE
jgi:cellulose biosynthesis protein BcsQ